MKILYIACIVIALLLYTVNHHPVYALSGYQAGFNHGVSDARDSCLHSDGCHWYILQPGHGFKFHSSEFVRGYVNGFCSIDPEASSDDDSATWDCARGPDSASWIN